jgi:flagellar hook-basal body complex protein FliE
MRIGSLPASPVLETNPAMKLDEMQSALAGALSGARPSNALAEVGAGDFSSLLSRAVTDVEGRMRAAESERQKVLTGETNNLHQATIASSEAGVAFSLMIEVRNKLVESYQELMRMQV